MTSDVRWEWKDDASKFVPLADDAAMALEKAYSDGEKTLDLKTNNWRYVFDLQAMTQTNIKTKKTRDIQRVGPPVAKKTEVLPEGEVVWEWRDDDAAFYPYSQKDSSALEAAHKAGLSSVELTMRGWKYSFDFKAMTQLNSETKTKRIMRRRLDAHKRKREEEVASPCKSPKTIASSSTSDAPTAHTSAAATSAPTIGLSCTWKTHSGTLLWRDYGALPPTSEIVGFDMDSTLIDTKSGKVFATSRSDWKWLMPEVPTTLKGLHKDGKRVVIFTNQNGINGSKGWDESKATMIRGKIDDLAKELGIPLFAFIATSDDTYRKPSTGMWDFMVKQLNGGTSPNLDKCLYVGDAAGRPPNWEPGRKKDFSCGDRKFAHNVAVDFKTPEEFFQKAKPVPFDWDGAIDPRSYKFAAQVADDGASSFHSAHKEIVVFCGFPGAGKSTFAKRYFLPHGYVHVNRDTLKTPKKCFDTAAAALASGKSCVIDNTMPKLKSDDKEKCNGREAYIKLAKEHGVPCRLFHFQAPEALAKHLNYYRERLTNGKDRHVPGIGYNTYKKGYEEPKMSEGYAEIKKIHFVPHFDSARSKNLFYQFA